PILGGSIAEHMSWRWVFYVNVPICLLGFLIIQALMEERPTIPIKADYISFSFMAIGVGCLEYFIDEGNAKNWFQSKTLVMFFATAILFLGFFIWRGLLGKSVINFQLFKFRNYVCSCLAVFILMILMISSLTFFPTLLQQGYGFPVDTAGYITAPRGLASFIAAPIFIRLGRKFDPRALMLVGLAIFACATYSLTCFATIHSTEQIVITGMLQGAGMMGIFVNLMQLTYTKMPAEFNSDAAGVFNFFRNIGSSVGTSIASTIIARQQQVSWHDLGEHVSHHFTNYQAFASKLPSNSMLAIAALQVQQQAFFIANLDVFYFAMLGVGLLVWIPFFLDPPVKVN
ncbi:MAG: MFS transporter, partial [Burkholderiales bacterium]